MRKFRRSGNETKKSVLYIYIILRVLVLIIMIRQLFLGEYKNALLCLLALVLFALPSIIQRRFKIELPSALEIIILLFIFSAEILGEINNFYVIIPHFDTVLHTINGFLSAGIGFSLVDILNKNVESIKLSSLFVSIVAFCFSMTIGVLWEFFEYGGDTFFKLDMQKDKIVQNIATVELDESKTNTVIRIDNIKHTAIYSENKDGQLIETIIPDGYLDVGINDTMKDLLVNFAGAVTFSVIGYLYISNRDKYKFIQNFLIKKK